MPAELDESYSSIVNSMKYTSIPHIGANASNKGSGHSRRRKFLASALVIAGFLHPKDIREQDLGMAYYGQFVSAEWLTSQTYNGGAFVKLIQVWSMTISPDIQQEMVMKPSAK